MTTARNVMIAAIPYAAKTSVRYRFMWYILKVDVIGFIVDFLNQDTKLSDFFEKTETYIKLPVLSAIQISG